MSYNTSGLEFEEDDIPLDSAFGVPGYDGIPDPFGEADELAEIVWRKGPVAKQFITPSWPRGHDAVERDTGAALRSEPRVFIEEDEMASWLCLPQEATGGGQNAIPLTELDRQPTALAAEGVSRMEAARGRESIEVGSSATPDAERAPPAGSRPITVGDINRFPSTDEDRTAAASSSGGGGGTRRTPHVSEERKRKLQDSDDSDAEDADYNSESKYKANLRSKRRTRSAEVHNLSERRRRDRINEKMKALQRLIPHCSKTDKASMLDDAVEYMKSLQLQIQMMGGMTPTTFPCIPQHTPPMGMPISGMGMDANLGNFVPRMWSLSPFMIGSAISMPTSVQSQATVPMPAYLPAMLAVNGQIPYQPAGQHNPNVFNLQGFNPAWRPAIPDPYHQYVGLHHIQIPQQNQTSAEQAGDRGANPIKTENPHGSDVGVAERHFLFPLSLLASLVLFLVDRIAPRGIQPNPITTKTTSICGSK